MSSLALAMCVRDEEEFIGSCLDSALEMGVDSYAIVDTGSTDKTKAIIKRKMKGVPGGIFDQEWQGFGPARSEALRRVRSHKPELILMLDADMTIHGELPTKPYSPCYMIQIRSGPWEVPLPLLTRGDLPWCYQGPVHSYLALENGGDWTPEWCGLWIDDRRPGGWRPGKIEEDARLLEAELELHPDDSRSSFYLAQTYTDLDRPADAIREYGRRITLNGNVEERYVAMVRRGRLLAARDRQAALSALLEAWEFRPTRAEGIYEAARQARIAGLNKMALMFSRVGSHIPYPPDYMFVEPDIYHWKMRLELGIAEVRAGDKKVGRQILSTLRQEEIPDAFKGWIDEILSEELGALSPDQVTAVIVTRGDCDLEPIRKTLPYKDILVWDNSQQPHDLKCFGRYVCADAAKNDVIYFQDDDIVFTEHRRLLDAYEPGRMVVNMPSPWYEQCYYDRYSQALVGGGALCPKGLWMQPFERYLAEYPRDDLFLEYCDFIFGMQAPHKRFDFGFEELPHAAAPGRIYNAPGALEKKIEMMSRGLRLREGAGEVVMA